MTSTLRSILFFLFVLAASLGYAQAPKISYTSPQVYTATLTISPVSPVNSGGVVPAPTPVTLAAGFNNPTGIAVDGAGNVYIAENGNSDVKEIPVGGGSILTLGSGFNHPTGVAVDVAGNVYVADNGNNAVKEIPIGGGAIITLGSGFNGPYGIAVDASGNLYVGDSNNNEVKKIPAGSNTPIIIGSGFNHPTGVAVDAAGNVYVADRSDNMIKKILAAGGSTVTLANGNGNPNGVAVDKNGNVYFADTDISSITEIPAGGGGNIAVGSGFNTATDVVVDAHLNVYVADNGNNAVKEVEYGGYSIAPALPEGLSFDTTTGIISGTPAAASQAKNYTVTAFNAGGSSMAIINITVNLPPKPVISYNTPQTYTTLVSVSPLSPVNSGGAVQTNGGYSINPALPAGLALDINTGIISGTPTVASPAANYIVTAVNSGGSGTATINIKVSPYPVPVISYKTPQVYIIGQPITPLMPTSSEVAPYSSGNSVTLASGFNNLTGIAIDGSGNVYVAENGSNAIDKIPAGSGTYTPIGSGFNTPTGVAVDAAGNVYVADNGNNAVKKIPAGGGAIVTLGSGFNGPYGIAVDASGNIYIGDSNNNEVKEIPAGSNTPIIIGSGFNHPTGVAVDAAGNVYVADRGSNLIKKILAAGGSTVILGNGDGNPNGVAADSQGDVYFADTNEGSIIEIPAAGGTYINVGAGFFTPTAVAINGSNIVYVGDNGNRAVKEIQQVGGYSISPALPTGLSFDNSTGIISGTPTANSLATNYTVKAYNIGGSGTAPLNISVVTPNAGLANLTLSSGILSPAFSTPTTGYTVAEANSITSITVTPTASDAGSTLTVNGTAVASGFASSAIPLTLGINTIKVIVTSSTQTIIGVYTLSVNRALSSNANLAGLSVSSGTLSPAFANAITNYTVYLPNSTASISVTPTIADATAAITVNGSPVASEAASAPITLNVGNNIITTVVTAQDGITTDTYTIIADRAGEAAENLSALMLSSGTLNPAFGDGINSYTASVASATTSITVTPTISTATSTITVNGTAVTSGIASMPVNLNVGANVISVVVTEQDGVTKNTYTVTVTRPSSSDAALSQLAINSGTLNPAFSAGTTNYTASVSNASASVTITPTTSDPSAIVTVNGTTVTSGTASGAITLSVGSNKITTIVTASNGVTKKTYTVTVTRESGNDNLSALTIGSGTLSPAFASATKTYTATVANNVASITVTPTTSDASATGVTVNGAAVTSGTASGPVALNVGSNKITIIVTAHDPSFTKTYTITVTRESGNDNLSALALSSGSLSPAFASGTKTYTASVANGVSSLTVTPTTSDASATGVTVNGKAVKSGTPSGAIALNAGPNTITIIVTAHDPSFTKTYTVTVTRAPSTNAVLSSLIISAGTLSPAFATQTTSYTATVANAVTSLMVTPTTGDPGATVTVNGTAVTSGTASGPIALNVGANTITTIVTALDGVTKKTYRITVTRESSNDNLSALTLSNGTLSPEFASGTKTYTASVANIVSSLTVTPTTTDPSATGVTVNGKAVKSGTASGAIPLIAGPNAITIIVTARDPSFTKTYTITVNKGPSANAILSSLSISPGALSPAFATESTAYTASVANGVTSVTVTPTTSNPGATVTVSGVAVKSGTVSGPIALNVGPNTITTVVTAQDGATKKTYTITVNRAPSTNAVLSGLSISAGSLSPTFASGTTSYTATVANTVASVTVTPVTGDPSATGVTVNGAAVTSATASGPLTLNVGSNTITTIVTAQDGVTKKTYTITVTRESGNDNLSALKLSSGSLSPAFASGTKTYTASVANSVSSVTVTPTTSDQSATGVTVNGTAVKSGTASGVVALSAGPNTITIIVTAHDPSFVKTYTITVTRASGSDNTVYQPVSVETPADSPQLADDGIIVHRGVSPNGDGIDDFLQIDNITSYPDNRLTIMNRNGILVYEVKGYDNISKIFDGHSNKTGQMQLPGTYFYSLDYTVKGITKHKTGFLVLKY